MATIHPLADRIKVLPLLPQDKTKGGIIIPDAHKDRPVEGIVLAVGRGKLLDSGVLVPIEVEEGDVVQFGRYAGIHVPDDDLGLDVILMRDEEVLGRKLRTELPDPLPGDPRLVAAQEEAAVASLAVIREEARAYQQFDGVGDAVQVEG